MNTAQPRRPAGVPTGGQFASKTQPDPGYTLDDGPGPATSGGRPIEPEIRPLSDGGREEYFFRHGPPLELPVLDDPDDGRPAVTVYRPDGTVAHEEHWSDDHLQDPDDGRPAVVVYHPDGTVETSEHWRDGQLHDPDDGRPAVAVYRPDGTVEREEHWQQGSRRG